MQQQHHLVITLQRCFVHFYDLLIEINFTLKLLYCNHILLCCQLLIALLKLLCCALQDHHIKALKTELTL